MSAIDLFSGLFSRSLRTEVEIDASIESVWKTIRDFESYPEWNTFIPSAKPATNGDIAVGSDLDIIIHVPGEKPALYRVRITELSDQQRLNWLGHFQFPGLIDGHHSLELRAIGSNRVQVIHREIFRGLLVPFVWRGFLNSKLKRGFIEMNDRLKKRSEKIQIS